MRGFDLGTIGTASKASVELPDFDIVLNHGDLPLLRTATGQAEWNAACNDKTLCQY